MYFVWKFNHKAQDFEPIGAFTKKAEADAFAADNSEGEHKAHVIEQSFEAFLDGFHRVRSGAVAAIIERLERVLTRVERAGPSGPEL